MLMTHVCQKFSGQGFLKFSETDLEGTTFQQLTMAMGTPLYMAMVDYRRVWEMILQIVSWKSQEATPKGALQIFFLDFCHWYV
jgi:hypothetical protein